MVFHVSKGNGHEVPSDILKDHKGNDAHDRYSAFGTFSSESWNDQQYCWSHIICDAEELEQFYGDDGRRIRRSLQTPYDKSTEYHGHGTM